MWNIQILGFDFYHFIQWFILYSVLGYLLECIYESVLQRKLVLDRGFATGPYCPIYAVGGLSVYFLLLPFRSNLFILFICGSLLATALEYITGGILEQVFGSAWWDYHNYPFNYKGRISLGTSIGWGFLTITMFYVLHPFVAYLVSLYDVSIGKKFALLFLAVFLSDLFFSVRKMENRPSLADCKAIFLNLHK